MKAFLFTNLFMIELQMYNVSGPIHNKSQNYPHCSQSPFHATNTSPILHHNRTILIFVEVSISILHFCLILVEYLLLYFCNINKVPETHFLLSPIILYLSLSSTHQFLSFFLLTMLRDLQCWIRVFSTAWKRVPFHHIPLTQIIPNIFDIYHPLV